MNFADTMKPDNTRLIAQQRQRNAREAMIEEARTARLSLYVIGERSDYAPVRISGQRFALSGEKVFSTNDRAKAQEIADKLNAHYRAKKIEIGRASCRERV